MSLSTFEFGSGAIIDSEVMSSTEGCLYILMVPTWKIVVGNIEIMKLVTYRNVVFYTCM